MECAFEPHLRFSPIHARAHYERQCHNPDALFLIAEHSDHPAGYVYAYLADTPAYFHLQRQCHNPDALYLEPHARHTGAATMLVEGVIAWAHHHQAWRITAGVYAYNQASLTLLHRLHFQPYHVTLVYPLDHG